MDYLEIQKAYKKGRISGLKDAFLLLKNARPTKDEVDSISEVILGLKDFEQLASIFITFDLKVLNAFVAIESALKKEES